ncbi:radical SAM family heme chaperone HemW [Litorimonas haliclonae]|uniref:radical SAM family heme chaperone HemW n=1 Tax=Litorimonas haliclonae TaxID=2081977 RepID=UPI0039EE0C2A
MTAKPSPLAIYIHWPYCTRICPYCDFNVYKSKGKDIDLVEAILADLEGWRKWSGPRQLNSIHFGGGTPSLLTPEEILRIIDKIEYLWGLPNGTEVALEANPIDANAKKWSGYRDAGINRLSLGVQTFHKSALEILGRDHNSKQALSALNLATSIFPSVSADLIFGWADQTLTDLNTDIEKVLESGVNHVSTYQLTIEPGTAFAKAETRGQVRAVEADVSADFFEVIMDRLQRAGFAHYEVSNFAKTGHKSGHNLAYWRGYDYVGVGPGAHGRLVIDGKKVSTIAALTPAQYWASVSETGMGIFEKETLSAEEWSEEYILMGLRTDEGVSLSKYSEIRGKDMEESRFAPLIEEDFLSLDGNFLKATRKGRFLLNSVTDALLV